MSRGAELAGVSWRGGIASVARLRAAGRCFMRRPREGTGNPCTATGRRGEAEWSREPDARSPAVAAGSIRRRSLRGGADPVVRRLSPSPRKWAAAVWKQRVRGRSITLCPYQVESPAVNRNEDALNAVFVVSVEVARPVMTTTRTHELRPSKFGARLSIACLW